MRRIEIGLDVPWTPEGVRVACAALTTINRLLMRWWARAGRPAPSLYRSGVTYTRRPPEHFEAFPAVLRRGAGDCDQLACWRAAELRERGIGATAVPIQKRRDLMHIVVRWPDGRIEDPSKLLGMGRRR